MSPAQPLAYSYIRFSTPEQMKGDSLRRQTAATAEWCAKNNVTLDTSTTLRDLGKSAYTGAHRKNPDTHALAAFLKLVEGGRVPRGSFLIVENLDRLTREKIRAAVTLCLGLIDAGIRIVQLSPSMMFDEESTDNDPTAIIVMVVTLMRGHSESKMKSQRVGEAWEDKREVVRANGGILTRQLPAWVREAGGVLQLIPEHAATVRRVYDLAAGGLGASLIVKALVAERRPPMGPSGLWSKAYVSLILGDRRSLGEFQPRHGDGTPAGEPIPDYFPPCVDEAEWLAARNGAAGRKQPRGRVGEHVNVFAGLLYNARDGDRYYVGTRTPKGKAHRVLINQRAAENGVSCCSFPFDVFEREILARLREVDPREVLGEAPGQDVVIVLAGELAHVQARQAELQAELLKGDVSALAKAARALDAREKELTEQLAEARRQAAYPAGEQWGECMSLADVVASATDPKEARLRLRGLLRGLVESIWVLAVGRGRDRLCAAQVYFKGDGHRDYLILSRPPKAGRGGFRVEGGSWSWSLTEADGLGPLDLRQPRYAKALEAKLLALDLKSWI